MQYETSIIPSEGQTCQTFWPETPGQLQRPVSIRMLGQKTTTEYTEEHRETQKAALFLCIPPCTLWLIILKYLLATTL